MLRFARHVVQSCTVRPREHAMRALFRENYLPFPSFSFLHPQFGSERLGKPIMVASQAAVSDAQTMPSVRRSEPGSALLECDETLRRGRQRRYAYR